MAALICCGDGFKLPTIDHLQEFEGASVFGQRGLLWFSLRNQICEVGALAIPALAHAQQSGPQPKKPTKADAQNVVQVITSDKVKTQAYCDLTKLEGQVKALETHTRKFKLGQRARN
jgi:hypothetical protein